MGLFTNGNARVTKLIIIQLALGQLVLVLNIIQGILPMFGLTLLQLQRASASIMIFLVMIKGGEMFFNKVATLFKNNSEEIPPVANPLSTGNTEMITKG